MWSRNTSGTYTAGDTIHIAVEFSQPVMVFIPPVIRLYTGKFNRSAIYGYGNYTNTLTFTYKIQVNDTNPDLDYVDTKYPPYKMNHFYNFAFKVNISFANN